MTNKFNVGDSLEFIEKYGSYEIGDKVTVTDYLDEKLINFDGKRGTGCALESRFKLSDKPTKNQRITTLENKVSELELIVHQLRDRPQLTTVINNVQGLSPIVEDIIEFEGKPYKKVDREAREGDVVIFHTLCAKDNVSANKPYKAMHVEGLDDLRFPNDRLPYNGCKGDHFRVYETFFGRTLETVDVYELIKEGLNPQILIADETVELTPNQQRKEIIEKAKEFIEENLKKLTSYDFVISEGLIKLCYRKVYREWEIAVAKCNPSDVFNEHIGKAIALGRALGLDVSEFENAVQPTIVVGQITNLGEVYAVKPTHRTFGFDKGYKFSNPGSGYTVNDNGYEHWFPINWAEIINDTNAIYGGEK